MEKKDEVVTTLGIRGQVESAGASEKSHAVFVKD